MSTIEKAAERLAALKAARVTDHDAKSDQPHAAVVSKKDAGLGQARLGDSGKPVSVNPFAYAERVDIDLKRLTESGFLTPESGRSQIVQEFRRIKRPLLLRIQKSRIEEKSVKFPNVVMVTSAYPGEGKTYVSVNLAMSLATEVNGRVLLVDGDVAKGDTSRVFQIDNRLGLVEVLQNPTRAEELILATNVDGLTLMSSGTFTEQLDELYASDRLTESLEAITSRDPDRVVVVDAPPLLATTEGPVLARNMGQVVLVVEANKTPRDAVIRALEELQDCPNVSLLLNKSARSPQFGYGYGYGYDSAGNATTTGTHAVAD